MPNLVGCNGLLQLLLLLLLLLMVLLLLLQLVVVVLLQLHLLASPYCRSRST